MARGQKPERGDSSQNEGGNMMKADAQDLWAGAQWLEWALDDYVDADEVNETNATSMADSIKRCIEYLRAESDRRDNRMALAAAKREYAAAHGIKVSQVRVSKKAVA